MKNYAFGVISIVVGMLFAGSVFATQTPINTGAEGAPGPISSAQWETGAIGTFQANEYMFGLEDGTVIEQQGLLASVESPGTGPVPGLSTPSQPTDPVPEPSSLMIFGLGLVGLGFATRRLRKHR